MPSQRPARVTTALATAGAAVVHVVVAVDHWTLWWGYGAMFVGAAVLQAVWAVAVLLSGSRALLVAGIAGNLAAIAAWVLTRTVGYPFGPIAGQSEAAGYPDVLTVALELIASVAAGWMLARPQVRPTQAGRYAIGVGASALALLAATSVAVGTAVTGHQHGDHGSGHGEGGHGHSGQHSGGKGSGGGRSEHQNPAPSSPTGPEPGSRTPPPQPEPTHGGGEHDHEHSH